MGIQPVIARAALHFWEEPCISGKEGSGAIFFSGCALHCVYCQNRGIAEGRQGIAVTEDRLADICLELQEQGANNINLVTAGHFLPAVVSMLKKAKQKGLAVPVVYNSGGYEKPGELEALRGLADIFLPDFKYISPELAERYSHAADYPERAKAALAKMAELAGVYGEEAAVFDDSGIMRRGMIVRHLVLPGHVNESKKIIRYLYDTYGNRIYLSLLSQYTPMPGIEKTFPELGRRITKREYERVVDYALSLGVVNGFVQSRKTAEESFIPEFDGTGCTGTAAGGAPEIIPAAGADLHV